MSDAAPAPIVKPPSPIVRFWIWNLILAVLLHLRFLAGVDPIGWQATLFLGAGLVGNAFVLSLVPAALTLPFAWLLRPWKRARRVVIALIWTAFLAALYLDGNIWGLFRYHFNGMVWATITNPAAGDAVHISTSEYVTNTLGFLALFGALFLGLRRLEARAPAGFVLRHRTVFLVIIALTLLEKGLFAYADLVRDRRTTAIARVFPMYQRLTIKRIAVKHFDVDLAERPRLDLKGANILLRYPHELPAMPADGPRPNIAIFVIDSLRADMLVPETMPALSAFAEDFAGGRTFTNHYSGGNATRFGLFTLLYSLHGNYWIPILSEETPPVLLRVLGALDYQFAIFSTASLNYPEFRSTAFVDMPERVFDDLPGAGPAEKDMAQVAAVDTFLAERDADQPFFLFSLIDSPHQVYSFPEDQTPFEPYATSTNYSGLANGASEAEQLELYNSYRNSVFHADLVLGEILRTLEERGVLDNTLVIVTGDHGEEFWEHGFFGHTSNFTREQVHVPFVMRGPGVEPGAEAEPTSHLDVVPTLLELLGAEPSARTDYALGENLLDAQAPERRRTVSGWDQLGMLTPDGILVVPTATHRGLVEGWTLDWQPLIDDQALIEREGALLTRLALECGRFMR